MTAQHKKQGKKPQMILSLLLAIFGIVSAKLPSQAAETVILKYSILRESVSVEELSQLADTGEASRSLRAYLKLANKEPEELRALLNNNVDVDPVFLSKVLNSFAGSMVLDPVGEVIHTPSKRANRESLRGALVTSALSDKNIRLIEIFENYPTEEIHVDGDRLAEIYQSIEGFVSKVPRLPF
ncbi:alpha/beta hydrolase [Cyanothece sp. BG0011]|uniref:alpha/beta hydrolase n=1 Tax=Cyanothece sp. BG0011 TaxID=2082950 RepID=UPI000D1EA8CC|nr:alpha/beta hydrolase [Cyanothece sp. BG0011]